MLAARARGRRGEDGRGQQRAPWTGEATGESVEIGDVDFVVEAPWTTP